MTGAVENAARRESRQQRVARLHAEGCSVADIASRLHLRNAQVANDLRNRRVAPVSPAASNVVPERIDWIGLHLATLREVQREAWRQWEASKKPRETRTVTERSTEQGTATTRTVRTTESNGDVKFLNLILRTLKEQARIYKKLAPNPKPVRKPQPKKPHVDDVDLHGDVSATSKPMSRKPLDDALGQLTSLLAGRR